MIDAEKEKLLALPAAYKEHMYNKLLELLAARLASIDRNSLQGLTSESEEVLGMLYTQGVAKALDNFDVQELLRALEESNTVGLKA